MAAVIEGGGARARARTGSRVGSGTSMTALRWPLLFLACELAFGILALPRLVGNVFSLFLAR